MNSLWSPILIYTVHEEVVSVLISKTVVSEKEYEEKTEFTKNRWMNFMYFNMSIKSKIQVIKSNYADKLIDKDLMVLILEMFWNTQRESY